MFHATMRAAIDGARTLANMDELSKTIWQAHAAGAVEDDQAQALAEVLHERRNAIRGSLTPVGIPASRGYSLFPPKRLQRPPIRTEALSRRRRLAASGPMPPALAARFTTGQLAVLRIIGDETVAKGVCGLCIDAIAARAGVCRRLAQTALRLAEGDGLIVIQERRHQGRKNEANLVRVISREWQQWLRRRRPRNTNERGGATSPDRMQKSAPHGYKGSQSGKSKSYGNAEGLPTSGGRPEWQSAPRIRADGGGVEAMR